MRRQVKCSIQEQQLFFNNPDRHASIRTLFWDSPLSRCMLRSVGRSCNLSGALVIRWRHPTGARHSPQSPGQDVLGYNIFYLSCGLLSNIFIKWGGLQIELCSYSRCSCLSNTELIKPSIPNRKDKKSALLDFHLPAISVEPRASFKITHIGTVVTPSDRMGLLHISSIYLHSTTVFLDLR